MGTLLFAEIKGSCWGANKVVPLKYPRIHCTAFQCSLPRLIIYPLTTPTACVIFGLVHTMAYIKFPAADE